MVYKKFYHLSFYLTIISWHSLKLKFSSPPCPSLSPSILHFPFFFFSYKHPRYFLWSWSVWLITILWDSLLLYSHICVKWCVSRRALLYSRLDIFICLTSTENSYSYRIRCFNINIDKNYTTLGLSWLIPLKHKLFRNWGNCVKEFPFTLGKKVNSKWRVG